MKKTILWSVVGILILATGVGAFLWLRRPQVVVLGDKTKLTLLGVEYGKHHKYPTVKLPGPKRTVQGPESFDTPEDSVVLWILQEHKGTQSPDYQTLVYDRAETGCVASWSRYNRQLRPGVEVVGVQLIAFPRRDRTFYVRFQQWGGNGQRISKDKFVVPNPARGSFPAWSPAAVPATQSDGDLEVTLAKLDCNAPGFNGGNRSSKDPVNKAVAATFHTEQNGTVVTNWQPVRIRTSDATGNQIENNSWRNETDANGDATMTYQWGLWPNEPAWKLRVEMSRNSGFMEDEVWVVTNIPVRAGSQQDLWAYGRRRTNSAFAEGTVSGITLKIFSAIQFTDQDSSNNQRRGGFRIMADTDPTTNGFRLAALKVTDDAGRTLQTWNGGWGGGNFAFQLPSLRNTKTINVTMALHKSRFVEFMVKPTK